MTSCDGVVRWTSLRASLSGRGRYHHHDEQEKTTGHHQNTTTGIKKNYNKMNNWKLIHPFSLCILLIVSVMMVRPSFSMMTLSDLSTTTATTTTNLLSTESSLLASIPSNLFINFLATPKTSSKSSNSTLLFNVVPIAIGDITDITCLECTLHAPVIYLNINDYGISFQYQFVSDNQCPSDFIKNFNQANYSDPDAYLAEKVSYSPQFTISDLVNVTLTDQTYTVYGALYRNNERMNSGVNCMNIKYSGNSIDTIAINLAANGICPPISSSPSCKLSSNTLFIVEQFVYITKKN